MSDRCYMTVYCRPQDIKVFEDIGFTLQNDPAAPLSILVDEEADYAHCNDIPKNVKWYGASFAGYEYPETMYACDGATFMECAVYSGRPILRWDSEHDLPDQRDVEHTQAFFKLDAIVRAELGQTDSE